MTGLLPQRRIPFCIPFCIPICIPISLLPHDGAPAPCIPFCIPPMHPFLTAYTIDFLRFEVYFSCSLRVRRSDSISAHVWYGLSTNLRYPLRLPFFYRTFVFF